MKAARAPQVYSVQLSALMNLQRTCEADPRLAGEAFTKLCTLIAEITNLLSLAGIKPLKR